VVASSKTRAGLYLATPPSCLFNQSRVSSGHGAGKDTVGTGVLLNATGALQGCGPFFLRVEGGCGYGCVVCRPSLVIRIGIGWRWLPGADTVVTPVAARFGVIIPVFSTPLLSSSPLVSISRLS